MSEALPKHQLLLKLLKMTTSANDGEALVAIRKANALLLDAKWDWERLLAGKITVVGDPFAGLSRPPEEKPSSQPASQAPPPFVHPSAPSWQAPKQPQATPRPTFKPAKPKAPRAAKPKVTLDDLGL